MSGTIDCSTKIPCHTMKTSTFQRRRLLSTTPSRCSFSICSTNCFVDQVIGLRVLDDLVRPVVHLGLRQPQADRHRETQLAAVQHVRRDDLLDRPAQRVLGGAVGDLLVGR